MIMSNSKITLRPFDGKNIDDVIAEAIDLAKLVNVEVYLHYNHSIIGITPIIPTETIKKYIEQIDTGVYINHMSHC